jgi:glycolate oxidase iron-sulfur subunit
MQTNIAEEFRGTREGEVAEEILRKCVHCGFCTATCPTYLLLGDELDGPRGRIYQIKQIMEGAEATPSARTHLDRCLTCRSCETTCPSGVEYGRLVDIGRQVVERKTRRPMQERVQRILLERMLSDSGRASAVFALARLLRPLLPGALAAKVAPRQAPIRTRARSHQRSVLLLEGCVQPALTPRTNQAAEVLLDLVGIGVVRAAGSGCCGALAHHLSFEERARERVRKNIDAWWPHIEKGAEAIVATASGCGVMLKDYKEIMRDDRVYADRAARVSEMVRDLSEFFSDAGALDISPRRETVAFHAPCTYQHGLGLKGRVETLLENLGYRLSTVDNGHLCCGSAGTYSVLQPDLSKRLLEQKLEGLMAGEPRFLVTANVGCQTHLSSQSAVPVLHWAELLVEDLAKVPVAE